MKRVCTTCGSDEAIVAVTPGSAPIWVLDQIPITHGAPGVAWCRSCWAAAFYRWEAEPVALPSQVLP